MQFAISSFIIAEISAGRLTGDKLSLALNRARGNISLIKWLAITELIIWL